MTRRCTRRQTLSALAGGAVLLTASPASSGLQQSTPTGQYPQQDYTAANTDAPPYAGPDSLLGDTWQTELESINGTPLVVDGRILLLTFLGSHSRVYGLDIADGSERWRYDLADAAVRGMLAADETRVYSAGIVEPRVVGIGVTDGNLDWETTVDAPGGYRMGPRVSGGSVFFLHGTVQELHEFDAASGELRRRIQGPFTRFAVDSGKVYGARGRPREEQTGVAVVDRTDPSDRFVLETPGRSGRPTIGEDAVYVGTSAGTVHAFDKAGGNAGDALWETAVDDWPVFVTPGAEHVLARTDDYLVALDRTSGEERWRVEDGTSRALVASNHIYQGREGGVAVLDPDTGSTVTTYEDDAFADGVHHLSVIDEALFVASMSGRVALIQDQVFTL